MEIIISLLVPLVPFVPFVPFVPSTFGTISTIYQVKGKTIADVYTLIFRKATK